MRPWFASLAVLAGCVPAVVGTLAATQGGGGSRGGGAGAGTAPALHLAFSRQPTDGVAGSALPSVSVEVLDAAGRRVTGAASAITLSLDANPGGDILGGTLTRTTLDGVATFPGLTLVRAAAGYQLRASSPGVGSARSASFSIAAGAAAALEFFAQPTTGFLRQRLPAVSVRAIDAYGNPVAAAPQVTIALGANAVGATLSGTRVVSAASGVATFTDLRLDRAGADFTLLASAPGLAGATSDPFRVLDVVDYEAGLSVAFPSAPNAVALTDVDGDGRQDLVVATWLTHAVTIRRGRDDGTFGLPTNYAVGSFPLAVLAPDLDGDGAPDLVVVNSGSNDVSVRLNDGQGDFPTEARFAVGSNPQRAALTDLDGDGDLDLVAVNAFSGTASILLGDGAGGFGAATSVAVGSSPHSVAAGDVDGDGDADVVTANRGANTLSVLLGAGDGTLGAPTTLSVGQGPRSVVLSDLDGDGDLDLVAANEHSDDLSVLLNSGAGTFGAATRLVAGETPGFVVAADLNGDGLPDLAAPLKDDDAVAVLLNLGGGRFVGPTTCGVGIGPWEVAAGDVDGDGAVDLAVANVRSQPGVSGPVGDRTVTVLRGRGDGTLRAGVRLTDGVQVGLSAVAGDLDGDGWTDLIVGLTRLGPWASVFLNDGFGRLGVNDGAGGYEATGGVGLGGDDPHALALGDLDGDGDLDLVVSSLANVVVFPGNGAGGFLAETRYALPKPGGRVTIADVDVDGAPDVLVAEGEGFSVLYNLRGGALTPPIDVDMTTGETAGGYLAVGDLNRDGWPDVVVPYVTSSGTGQVAVVLGAGSGAFSSPARYAAGAGGGVAIGDVDGDGIDDLAVSSTGGLDLLLGVGDGTLRAPQPLELGAALPPVLADLDGDGRVDVLGVSFGSGELAIRSRDAAGDFQAERRWATGPRPRDVVVADWDRDGRPDLAVINETVSSDQRALVLRAR